MLESHFSWQPDRFGDVAVSIFAAGTTFGDAGVSHFKADAIFGDVAASLFVASAILGDVGLSLFVAGAAFGDVGLSVFDVGVSIFISWLAQYMVMLECSVLLFVARALFGEILVDSRSAKW